LSAEATLVLFQTNCVPMRSVLLLPLLLGAAAAAPLHVLPSQPLPVVDGVDYAFYVHYECTAAWLVAAVCRC
jgi:hypothetical protein